MMSIKRKAILTLGKAAPHFWANQLHNPVFVIGVARSGTSLLANLIGYHKDVINWSELNDIWDPRGYPWWASDHSSPPVWVDSEAYTQRWWRDARSRQTEISAIFGVYQFISRKRIFVNKSPLNTYRIPYLLEMFPEARFIHLVRDGRAVVASYVKRQYARIQKHPEPFRAADAHYSYDGLAVKLAEFWQATIEKVSIVDKELGLVGQKRLLEVTYESLCTEPKTTMSKICRYLDIDPSRFLSKAWKVEVRSQNHKWREVLSPDLADQVTFAMNPILAQRGYIE